MGEGGRAGQTHLDQVFIEEVLMGTVFVGVEVDIGQRPSMGVLRITDAGDPQPDDALGENLFRVA
jgi:hypothetical protein